MIRPGTLEATLGPFLAAQRWFAGAEAPASVALRRLGTSRPGGGTEGWPVLVEAIVDADGATYQVTAGLRPAHSEPEFLRGRDDAVIGVLETDLGPALAYEAILDPELSLLILELVSEGSESAERVRPLGVEQSNTSLVYDERLILKLFRRLHPGRSRDVEMTRALVGEGFHNVAPVVAARRIDAAEGGADFDLAVVQPYLLGATEGWALAQTSLRDLFGLYDTMSVPVIGEWDDGPPQPDPAMAGGDFSAEARRLGAITAEMHLALARALGGEADPAERWARSIGMQLRALDHPAVDVEAAEGLLDRLRRLGDLGPAIHAHGDLHLAQVLRTDAGWFVVDFEGEPARSLEERWHRSPGLRDVAGMLRSFHYAAQVAVLGQGEDHGEELAEAAAAWEGRNRHAFFDGYVSRATPGGLVPSDPAAVATMLGAFELEKATYELAYETEYRPEWAPIPLAGLERLGIARR